jgi:hypothetical protein
MLTDFRFTIKYLQIKQARKALGVKPQALRAVLSLLKIYRKIVSVESQKKKPLFGLIVIYLKRTKQNQAGAYLHSDSALIHFSGN